MPLPYIASTKYQPGEAGSDDFKTVLEIPADKPVDHLCVVYTGDDDGYWRLVEGNDATPAVFFPAGGGEPGQRKTAMTIPCPGGFSGKLQIKAAVIGGRVKGFHAWGMDANGNGLWVVENPNIAELDDDSDEPSYRIVSADTREQAMVAADFVGSKDVREIPRYHAGGTIFNI